MLHPGRKIEIMNKCVLKIGDMYLYKYDDENIKDDDAFWLSIEGGEGMTVLGKDLGKILKEFYDKNF